MKQPWGNLRFWPVVGSLLKVDYFSRKIGTDVALFYSHFWAKSEDLLLNFGKNSSTFKEFIIKEFFVKNHVLLRYYITLLEHIGSTHWGCDYGMFPERMSGNESMRFTRALRGPYQSVCRERSESVLRTYSEFLVPTGKRNRNSKQNVTIFNNMKSVFNLHKVERI